MGPMEPLVSQRAIFHSQGICVAAASRSGLLVGSGADFRGLRDVAYVRPGGRDLRETKLSGPTSTPVVQGPR